MKVRMPSRQFNNIVQVQEDTHKLVSGNITFGNMIQGDEGQNIKGAPVGVVTPGVANTEFVVTHNLNEIPTGYLILNKNKSADFYDSGTAWTVTQIFLKCTVATVSAQIFVLA